MGDVETENLNEYVAIGPTPESSMSVRKETFDKTFIAVTIIGGLILLGLVILIIFWAYDMTKPKPIPQTINVRNRTNDNVGGVNSLLSTKNIKLSINGSSLTNKYDCENQNAKWVNGKCQCNGKYFGPHCNQEIFDAKYTAIGIPEEDVNGTVIKSIPNIMDLSFNENSCTEICDRTENCNGVVFEDGYCNLLSGDIIAPSPIYYHQDIQSTLYVKDTTKLKFTNNIYLGEYYFSFPTRYWLVESTNHYIQLKPNEISKINFYPRYIKINNSYTGIYSRQPFKLEHANDMITYPNLHVWYIHQPNTQLNLPRDFQYTLPLYVVYI